MPAGELGIGVNQTMVSLDIDQVQRIGVGNLLVVIGRIDLVGNQELPLADRIRMGVQVAFLAVRVVHVSAFFGQEVPAGFRPAFDEHLGRDVHDGISVIPLDVTRFVRIRTPRTDALAEVDQQDRSQAASLRIVAGPHAHEAMTVAGHGLRVHVDGRIVVGDAEEFLRPAAVGIHGPDRFGDPSALVDVFPAVVHDPAVIENHRAEFADRAAGELFDVGAVRIHAVQVRSHEGPRPTAQHGVFAAG